MAQPTFEEYVAGLGRLAVTADPTQATAEAAVLEAAGDALDQLPEVTEASLAAWVADHPQWVPALGLAVGLSQERLKNELRHAFGTSGWVTLARNSPTELISHLQGEYGVVDLVTKQRGRSYSFGEVLVARGGTRSTATAAGASGRRIEDEIEVIATSLGLACEARTRFSGRDGRTAPCDLAVPSGQHAAIVVAAKGFDSTGSKLTDAVREVMEMAEVRTPRQYVFAVIDGIGWKSRGADLRRLYDLWSATSIDGMYTLSSLDQFRLDLADAARLRGLLP